MVTGNSFAVSLICWFFRNVWIRTQRNRTRIVYARRRFLTEKVLKNDWRVDTHRTVYYLMSDDSPYILYRKLFACWYAESRSVAFFFKTSSEIQTNIRKSSYFELGKRVLLPCPFTGICHNILFSWHNMVAFITCYSSHAPPQAF
jgi:hypothetical protein